jgi:hypothetical protein
MTVSLASNMLFIVISVFFGVLLIEFLLRGLLNPLSHVPGPWYSRYTTLVLTYVTISGRRTHYVHELHEKYGTYSNKASREAIG